MEFNSIRKLIEKTKKASRILAITPPDERARALTEIARSIKNNRTSILEANNKDCALAEADGIEQAFMDRLRLTSDRLISMAAACEEVASLPDPTGQIEDLQRRPNGLWVGRRRIPLGVIGVIYEARPNVTSDAAGLCLRSGNAIVLKGGSRALNSNRAIVGALRQGLEKTDIPPDVVGFVDDSRRESVLELLGASEFIDVIIPRGGEGLIRFVTENSKIPVIKHYKGVCHIFVDSPSDAGMAADICVNAKVQRPSVCNAMETLLIHREVAHTHLPVIWKALKAKGVRLHGCHTTLSLLEPQPEVELATTEDWYKEYLSLDLAVKIVDSLDEAVAHIEQYGSDHSESIITDSQNHAQKFLDQVQSAVVLVNASTRFSDGGQLGLGAEIGISTTRLHAYGPMGLKELTTTKFIVTGNGQIRT